MQSTKSTTKVNRPPTLRVKRVPNHFEAETLKAEITNLFEARAEIHSLEPSDDRCLCATVTFPDEDSDFLSKALSTDKGGENNLLYDTQFIGITPLFDAKAKAQVDIIAVHGLGAHAYGTFRSPVNSKMWLRDFLKIDFPNIRVLLYGYDSKVDESDDTQSLQQLAITCLRNIVYFRKATDTEDRPIIFLGQCQGGFLVQELLIIAEDKDESPERNIFDKWYGFIGFGIPIHGLKNDGLRDDVEGRPNMRSIGQFTLDEYGLPPAYLDALSRSFDKCHREKNVDILYYEETRTSALRRRRKLEPQSLLSVRSSDSPLRNVRTLMMDTDHSRMVKFKDINDPNYYENVRKEISGMAVAAVKFMAKKEEYDIREFSACLKSLAFIEIDQRGNEIHDKATGTCEWLLKNEAYTTWIAQRRGLLWIMGNPGTGKSTLMKYALALAVKRKMSSNKHVLASFFFHGRGADLQKSSLGLFRSLLHQILVQVPEELSEFNSKFLKECETKLKPGEVWVWQEEVVQTHLKNCITRVLKTSSVHLYIDALDEGGERVARELVDFFQKLILQNEDTEHGLSICFSCRYYPIVVPDQELARIRVELENGPDIVTYIRGQLKPRIQDTTKAQELEKMLVKKAEKVFQWVFLVTNMVILFHDKGRNIKFIQKKIDETPTDLNELYRDILASIDEDEKLQSLKLIQWICFALRPLSLAELRFAMAVDVDPPYRSLKDLCQESTEYSATDDDMEKRVRTLSGGLAEVRKHRNEQLLDDFDSASQSDFDKQGQTSSRYVVQFIHQSVNDYLLERGLGDIDIDSTSTVKGRAHFRLSRACLKYIAAEEVLSASADSTGLDASYVVLSRRRTLLDASYGVLSGRRTLLKHDFPFLSYAVTSWALHAELVEAEQVSQKDLLSLLYGPSDPIFSCWITYNRILGGNNLPQNTTLLHVAAIYGLLSVATAITETEENINIDVLDSNDKKSRTPLSCALERGHIAIIKLLLEKGADVNAQGGRFGNALSAASARGNEDIVRLLLEKGADVNAQVGPFGNALSVASAGERGDSVRLLLEKGADVNAQGGYNGNALSAASARGRGDIVRLLLKKGADVNAQGGYDGNALSVASARGHEDIVRLLLEKGADVNAQGGFNGNALSAASARGHEDIVRLLHKKGAR